VTGRSKLAVGIYAVVAVLLGVVAYLLLTGDEDGLPPAPTPAESGPPWPLTGLASVPGDPLDRPAVAVKVSNSATARPQAGIVEADQVWEEQVEGISRFIAVFHSTGAAPVGPVRSARDSDVDLLGAFGRPVFVWGGANEGVAARVAASPLVSFNVDPDSAPDKFRDDQRPAPDNLFIDGTEPFFGAEGASPPVAQFSYRRADEDPSGAASTGAEIDWGGTQAAYAWDESVAGWVRFVDGTRQLDADGRPVAPANVVVLLTDYGAAPSDPRSPVALTVGTGEATVFSAGRQIAARWARPSTTEPYRITDVTTGQPVAMTPGPTWVALAEPGRTAFLDQARADELLALPVDPG
jgi:hypothetical protein